MRAPTSSGFAPRSRVILACLALLIAAPAAARAQDARLAARLDSLTGRQVAELLDAARGEKLPVEPLVDKALEGASKRVAGPLIVDAVRKLSDRLLEARQILGAQAPESEVTAAAHALRGGLQPAALRRLHERRGRTPLVAALGVFQELRGLRVTADTAAAVAVALQEAGVSAEQIAEFQREVAREIAVGGQPAMVAAVATELMAGDGAFRNGAAGPESANAGSPNTLNGTSGGAGNTTRPKRKP